MRDTGDRGGKKADATTGPHCPHCRKTIDMAQFLKSVTVFDRGTISGVARCPFCRNAVVFQVRNNKMTIGYTSASRFESLSEVEARGLKCIRDKEGVHYVFRGVTYDVPFRSRKDGDKGGEQDAE